MSSSEYERVDELTAEALALPHGDLRVRLLEEAVGCADATRDIDVIFEAKLNLANTAGFSGYTEKSLAAFAWCLAQFEADPERFQFQESSVLWLFKNTLHNVDELPQIPVDQIEALHRQMATLYGRSGYNMRPVHYTRMAFLTTAGDREAATEAMTRYRAEPRDGMADCIGCEADNLLYYYELIDDLERGVDAVGPNLAGVRSCAEVPYRTYSDVLRSLALLGRYEEADEYQRKGYRMIRNNRNFLRQVACQMLYHVHRGRLQSALRLFERHLSWALDTREMRSRYFFYAAARRTLAEMADRQPLKQLDLPETFPAYDPAAKYDLAALAGWFETEQVALGKRFDARNGNEFFTAELAQRLQY